MHQPIEQIVEELNGGYTTITYDTGHYLVIDTEDDGNLRLSLYTGSSCEESPLFQVTFQLRRQGE